MLSLVATRYAQALAEAVLDRNSGVNPKDVLTQLQGVEELVRQSLDLRHVLMSPAVANSKKRAVMARLGADMQLSPRVRNFLFIVIDHRRMDQFSGIREAFELALDAQLGIVRADVTSAGALTDTQSRTLEAELMKITGKRIRMRYEVDSELIGGVVTRIGSTVYDGSVKGQLEAMRRRLVVGA
jgi:F-type H+-transporting ATPase subunit delta